MRVATRLGDPEAGLTAIADLRRRLETWEGAHVDEAVAAGWSWQQIAESLGVTKQGAMKVMQPLLDAGLMRRVGTRKTGRYILA